MYVFIVLHYLSEEMTIECVEKLMALSDADNSHIIIVDNASANGSGKRIAERYKGSPQCTVLLNEKNLGFAGGNNIGYKYAKEHFPCEFIIILNNDVIIEDKDFAKKTASIHAETGFDVLGPDIVACKTGIHQNPMNLRGYSKAEVRSIIRSRQRWLTFYPIHYFVKYCTEKVKDAVKKLIRWKPMPAERFNPSALLPRIEDPVLHGACLIFSSHFIDREEEAFNPNTFLYMEEDLLHYHCKKSNYKMIYDSSICVDHMEDVATNLEFGSDYAKRKMKYRNLVRSATVLLNEMEQSDNEE